MNNSSYHNDVVYTSNGEIFHPIILSFITITIKIILITTGVPINLMLLFPLIYRRQFCEKARYVFQSGISLSYLSFFLPPVIELIYYLRPAETVCEIFIATVFVPQACLLVNCLLALIDRSLAMAYPLQHREMMTDRLARYIVFICTTLIVILVKLEYITEPEDIHCEIWLSHVRKSVIILVILLVLCLLLNIHVYRQTKMHLNEARTIRLGTSEGVTDHSALNDHSTVSAPLSVHISRRKLNEMELQANFTLVISISSLLVMPCLGIGFVTTFLTCKFVYGDIACASFLLVAPFIRDISLIPAIYGPIILIARNKELSDLYKCQRKQSVNENFD